MSSSSPHLPRVGKFKFILSTLLHDTNIHAVPAGSPTVKSSPTMAPIRSMSTLVDPSSGLLLTMRSTTNITPLIRGAAPTATIKQQQHVLVIRDSFPFVSTAL